MLNAKKEGSVPWWKFWNPNSSFFGGMIMGAVLYFLVIFLVNY